ncbi:MAG: hypothetical protein HS108_00570 [Planctomycetes bacterium]|nr:hypothetical protein [Planctomycetota bacterium]
MDCYNHTIHIAGTWPTFRNDMEVCGTIETALTELHKYVALAKAGGSESASEDGKLVRKSLDARYGEHCKMFPATRTALSAFNLVRARNWRIIDPFNTDDMERVWLVVRDNAIEIKEWDGSGYETSPAHQDITEAISATTDHAGNQERSADVFIFLGHSSPVKGPNTLLTGTAMDSDEGPTAKAFAEAAKKCKGIAILLACDSVSMKSLFPNAQCVMGFAWCVLQKKAAEVAGMLADVLEYNRGDPAFTWNKFRAEVHARSKAIAIGGVFDPPGAGGKIASCKADNTPIWEVPR